MLTALCLKITKKSHFWALRAKWATFKILRFFQPFLPFENLFRSLELFYQVNYVMKWNSCKDLQRFLKVKKGFATRKKYENSEKKILAKKSTLECIGIKKWDFLGIWKPCESSADPQKRKEQSNKENFYINWLRNKVFCVQGFCNKKTKVFSTPV